MDIFPLQRKFLSSLTAFSVSLTGLYHIHAKPIFQVQTLFCHVAVRNKLSFAISSEMFKISLFLSQTAYVEGNRHS